MAKQPTQQTQKLSSKPEPPKPVATPARDFRETQPGNALATSVAAPAKPNPVEKAPLKYDWLSIPRGMLNLTDAGVEFRDENSGARNIAIAAQHRALLEKGYRLHPPIPDGSQFLFYYEKA